MRSREKSGRRSRMEIMGDVLRVIDEGSNRPTKIMHGANLTWPPLMVHLEALLRNQLITQETHGNRSTYRLTAKGSAVLSMYRGLKEETGVLELEASAEYRMDEFAHPPSRASGRKTLSSLRSSLTAANFRVLENVVVGRSGTGYTFRLLVQGLSTSRYGFVFLTNVDESAVISSFVKQLDTEVDLSIIYVKGVSDEARRIAAIDSIPLLSASNLDGFGESLTFLDAFRSSRSLLLEVDPSENYERVIGALVRREAESCGVSVFTWKESRIYPVIAQSEKVAVHIMPSTRGQNQARKSDETVFAELPKDSSAGTGGKGRLLIFDSVSELLTAFGTARARRLLRALQASADVDGQRSIFILKRGTHEKANLRLVGSLVRNRLVYDGSGLRLPREV